MKRDFMAFEDFIPGMAIDLGSYPVEMSEMIDFAKQYDPQPFHLSDEGAEGTIFGRLAASGWHTATLALQVLLAAPHAPLPNASLIAIRDLRWRRPMYPNDALTLSAVLAGHAAPSPPTRLDPASAEQITLDLSLRNQDDVVVLSLQATLRLAEPGAG